MLLLLDNFEHVVEAAPLVSDLLASSPKLNILITSRLPLHLYGECVYQVDPFSLPDVASLPPTEQLANIEAIQLFVDRASAVKSDFTLNDNNAQIIAQICARLDGLPLAIELTAARSRIFPPQIILDRLESRMEFVNSSFRDLSPRESTLRAAIDWSHDLLVEDEQILFRRLAVFSGGATAEAIESVFQLIEPGFADSEHRLDIFAGLESLLDHSLLRPSASSDESRFAMLETIREYAQERLEESGEAELVRRHHADYFFALAKTAEPELRRAEQVAWLDRLENEHNNLRIALAWLAEHRLELGLEMAAALGYFWHVRGYHKEAREWLSKVLTTSQTELGQREVYVRAQDVARLLTFFDGRVDEALELARRIGDSIGIAAATSVLGHVAAQQNDCVAAVSFYEQSLAHFREAGDQFGINVLLNSLSNVAQLRADYETAKRYLDQRLQVGRELGNKSIVTESLYCLGLVSVRSNQFEEAHRYFAEGLQSWGEIVPPNQ
jgi:predicted ATPase